MAVKVKFVFSSLVRAMRAFQCLATIPAGRLYFWGHLRIVLLLSAFYLRMSDIGMMTLLLDFGSFRGLKTTFSVDFGAVVDCPGLVPSFRDRLGLTEGGDEPLLVPSFLGCLNLLLDFTELFLRTFCSLLLPGGRFCEFETIFPTELDVRENPGESLGTVVE